MTFTELARQLGTRTDRLLEYVRRADDPLPVRLLPNRGRGGVVNVAEFDAWFARNAVPYGDR
ncbi:MAG: hypothetical protein HFJ72_08575 [Adlercreutzia sp.]|nr:hypothetical protein [Adlercreutzia sp.]